MRVPHNSISRLPLLITTAAAAVLSSTQPGCVYQAMQNMSHDEAALLSLGAQYLILKEDKLTLEEKHQYLQIIGEVDRARELKAKLEVARAGQTQINLGNNQVQQRSYDEIVREVYNEGLQCFFTCGYYKDLDNNVVIDDHEIVDIKQEFSEKQSFSFVASLQNQEIGSTLNFKLLNPQGNYVTDVSTGNVHEELFRITLPTPIFQARIRMIFDEYDQPGLYRGVWYISRGNNNDISDDLFVGYSDVTLHHPNQLSTSH